MSINPVSSLSNSYLQQVLGTALSNNTSATASGTSGANANSLWNLADNNSLSPFAQMLTSLQQLQQSNPTEYQQVTEQIAGALQGAAQTAQSDGNTTAATQLNQLSTDFTSASQSAQLPNVQDLAKAVGGGHHHHGHGHHHFDASSSSSTSGDSTQSASGTATSASSSVSQLLNNLQNSNTQTFNPTQIILNTLSNAGVLNS